MPQKSREDRNAEAIWSVTSAYFKSQDRSQRAIDQLTEAIHSHRYPDSPEADALRIALGLALGSREEATS